MAGEVANAPDTQIPGQSVDLTATADQQLEAIRKKRADYTTQLETNTTKAANVGRLNQADAMEAQKSQAKQAAMAAGRPWTNADEQEWSARAARQQQQTENAMLLGREKTLSDSLSEEERPVEANIKQQENQKQQQLQAAELVARNTQSAAERAADAEYKKAMLKLQEQQVALQQAQQLQTQMYGPSSAGASTFSGAGTNYFPATPTTGIPGNAGTPAPGFITPRAGSSGFGTRTWGAAAPRVTPTLRSASPVAPDYAEQRLRAGR